MMLIAMNVIHNRIITANVCSSCHLDDFNDAPDHDAQGDPTDCEMLS